MSGERLRYLVHEVVWCTKILAVGILVCAVILNLQPIHSNIWR